MVTLLDDLASTIKEFVTWFNEIWDEVRIHIQYVNSKPPIEYARGLYSTKRTRSHVCYYYIPVFKRNQPYHKRGMLKWN